MRILRSLKFSWLNSHRIEWTLCYYLALRSTDFLQKNYDVRLFTAVMKSFMRIQTLRQPLSQLLIIIDETCVLGVLAEVVTITASQTNIFYIYCLYFRSLHANIKPKQWNHHCFTYKRDTGVVTIFSNGKLNYYLQICLNFGLQGCH